ncbi:MAG: hypothetical protein JNK72_12310 [Myxococcales bacterium]|nr:hypothetical protein [Myxococcales bacterium]
MKKFGAFVLCCAALSVAAGCSDDSTSTPTDAGTVVTDTGGGGDAGGGADAGASMCYREDGTAALCPMSARQASMTSLGYRLQYINITAPSALANQVLLNIVNQTFQAGTFLWGLSIDTQANTFRTGALNLGSVTRGTVGRGLLDGTFRFFSNNAPNMMGNRYDPIAGSVTVMGDRAATAMSTTVVNIPIFSDDTATNVLTVLPLSNLRLSQIQLTSDRRCIGVGRLVSGRFDECRSPWSTTDTAMMPYAQIDADITVADARNVEIAPLNTTLFRYITGLTDNMADPMTAAEGRRPDSMVGGMPAFHLVASFAAVAANIAP